MRDLNLAHWEATRWDRPSLWTTSYHESVTYLIARCTGEAHQGGSRRGQDGNQQGCDSRRPWFVRRPHGNAVPPKQREGEPEVSHLTAKVTNEPIRWTGWTSFTSEPAAPASINNGRTEHLLEDHNNLQSVYPFSLAETRFMAMRERPLWGLELAVHAGRTKKTGG